MSHKQPVSLEIFTTKDGSNTIRNLVTGDTYHSVHGARQESMHVFIEHGLRHTFNSKPGDIRVLEIGFGTGLNALLTLHESHLSGRNIVYHTLEKYPVPEHLVNELNYVKDPDLECYKHTFRQLHQQEWNIESEIHAGFTFTKFLTDFNEFHTQDKYDIIYHDAFAPDSHQEAWSEDFLQKCHTWLVQGGNLITYCAKGSFKRSLKNSGFSVEALIGPPGKREITRAVKL